MKNNKQKESSLYPEYFPTNYNFLPPFFPYSGHSTENCAIVQDIAVQTNQQEQNEFIFERDDIPLKLEKHLVQCLFDCFGKSNKYWNKKLQILTSKNHPVSQIYKLVGQIISNFKKSPTQMINLVLQRVPIKQQEKKYINENENIKIILSDNFKRKKFVKKYQIMLNTFINDLESDNYERFQLFYAHLLVILEKNTFYDPREWQKLNEIMPFPYFWKDKLINLAFELWQENDSSQKIVAKQAIKVESGD